MKLRSTTPAFPKKIGKKSTLIAAAMLMAVAMPTAIFSEVHAESIGQLQARINALQSKQNKYKSAASDLSRQEDTLANKINQLNAQLNEMQTQIDLSQAKADKLEKQIAETKKEIAQNKTMLGNTLADMYVDGSTTPLEMLASSKNIGDYLDKQTYQSTVSNQLSSTINKITRLKAELEKQQKEVKLELANEKAARSAVASAQAQKQQILTETRGRESAYRSMIRKNQSQQNALSRQIAAQMAATISSGGATVLASGGGGGGYPYNCYVDANGYSAGFDGHGYGCSQCVSYAAWMFAQVYGLYPTGWGNANTFPSNAQAAGFHVSSNPQDVPASGAIVFFPYGVNGAGPVGHVGWVYAVSGNTIFVKQYNYNTGNGWGKYSQMTFQNYGGMEYIYP